MRKPFAYATSPQSGPSRDLLNLPNKGLANGG